MAETQSAQQFSLQQFNAPSGDVLDPGGNVINPANSANQLVDQNGVVIMDQSASPPVPSVRGQAIIRHWMDAALATGWIRAARTYLNADNGGVARALRAIMMVYNALNIPWQTDPAARGLWRQYVAGPPQINGSTTTNAEFGNANYNDGWFSSTKNNSQWPGWGCASGGCVPARSRPAPGRSDLGAGSLTDQEFQLASRVPDFGQPITKVPNTGGNYVELAPTAWPFINIYPNNVDSSGNPIAEDLSGNPVTEVQAASDQFNDSVTEGFIDERQGPPRSNFLLQPGGAFREANNPAGPNVTENVTDTAQFSFDNPTFGYKRIGFPQDVYVPWIDAWITALNTRTPQTIVAQARTYTAYLNNEGANYWGGATAFVTGVINLPATWSGQEQTGALQNGLMAAATAAAGIGAALAGPTFGISAIIGGAASLGLMVAKAVVRNGTNIPRDDLGRWKPYLERGWLSGNPGDATGGQPIITVPGPDGWTRNPFTISFGPNVSAGAMAAISRVTPATVAIMTQSPGGPGTPGTTGGASVPTNVPPTQLPVPASPSSSSTIKKVAIVAVVGGLAYAGYRFLQAKQDKPS